MITELIKLKIEHVVNVFETGTVTGKYDAIVVMADGVNNTRQITYGRSQTTEQGNLVALVRMYVTANGLFADDFRPYIDKIGKESLVNDLLFRKLLVVAARKDAIMRQVQDDFFDVLYYQPAFHFFNGFGFILPLSLLVIYDSFIQSGGIPDFLRKRFTERPPSAGGDEETWTTAYTHARNSWLSTHSRKILRKTAYRTACLLDQVSHDNWMLDQEVVANGILVP